VCPSSWSGSSISRLPLSSCLGSSWSASTLNSIILYPSPSDYSSSSAIVVQHVCNMLDGHTRLITFHPRPATIIALLQWTRHELSLGLFTHDNHSFFTSRTELSTPGIVQTE
jgi:hypothetical protein